MIHKKHTQELLNLGMMVHTSRPEISEYFLAGLNDGGASMVLSITERASTIIHSLL
jgi:hypothetical protein